MLNETEVSDLSDIQHSVQSTAMGNSKSKSSSKSNPKSQEKAQNGIDSQTRKTPESSRNNLDFQTPAKSQNDIDSTNPLTRTLRKRRNGNLTSTPRNVSDHADLNDTPSSQNIQSSSTSTPKRVSERLSSMGRSISKSVSSKSTPSRHSEDAAESNATPSKEGPSMSTPKRASERLNGKEMTPARNVQNTSISDSTLCRALDLLDEAPSRNGQNSKSPKPKHTSNETPRKNVETSTPSKSTPKRVVSEASNATTSKDAQTSSPSKSTANRVAEAEASKDGQANSPSKSKPKKVYAYTHLKDCISKDIKYNVWAVITKISRQPAFTKRGNKLMAQVYIRDQDFPGSYEYDDYQFSLLGMRIEDFPPLKVGSVVRIHYMVVQTVRKSRNLFKS